MIKFISFVDLKPGVDPDKAYEYWRGPHIDWAKKMFVPEARRYVISRVIHPYGDVGVYGFAEVWYDDKETALKVTDRLIKADPDPYLRNYITRPKRMLVQEEEIPLP